jgi:hypothetical protein
VQINSNFAISFIVFLFAVMNISKFVRDFRLPPRNR